MKTYFNLLALCVLPFFGATAFVVPAPKTEAVKPLFAYHWAMDEDVNYRRGQNYDYGGYGYGGGANRDYYNGGGVNRDYYNSGREQRIRYLQDRISQVEREQGYGGGGYYDNSWTRGRPYSSLGQRYVDTAYPGDYSRSYGRGGYYSSSYPNYLGGHGDGGYHQMSNYDRNHPSRWYEFDGHS